ncbi:MAG: hypothetical protein M1833_005453 [Piccolia ochrophora]|nr:MAG: hypothetical protein M1833_005453 [Piccolia ochrophora]
MAATALSLEPRAARRPKLGHVTPQICGTYIGNGEVEVRNNRFQMPIKDILEKRCQDIQISLAEQCLRNNGLAKRMTSKHCAVLSGTLTGIFTSFFAGVSASLFSGEFGAGNTAVAVKSSFCAIFAVGASWSCVMMCCATLAAIEDRRDDAQRRRPDHNPNNFWVNPPPTIAEGVPVGMLQMPVIARPATAPPNELEPSLFGESLSSNAAVSHKGPATVEQNDASFPGDNVPPQSFPASEPPV